MTFRRTVLVGLLLVVAGAAAIGWYKYIAHPKPVACGYCRRPLHANVRVTAEIAGKRTQVCCAACAISEANQEHKPLRLISVHDYSSGRVIPPDDAWFVKGSRAMACDHDAMRMNERKGTAELTYDRCSPGILAFANRQDAVAFTTDNGGDAISFRQLMSEAKFQ